MKITAEVEVEFEDGKRTIEMNLKERQEIEDCQEGKVVILNLRNGEAYTGIFVGMDSDEEIILRSASKSDNRLGFKVWWLRDYLEQV